MPYGKSIPIKNAGRVMEQFVQIVVPRGTQQAASSFMGGNAGALAGVDGHQNASKYQNAAFNSTNSTNATSSGSNWKQHAWAQN